MFWHPDRYDGNGNILRAHVMIGCNRLIVSRLAFRSPSGWYAEWGTWYRKLPDAVDFDTARTEALTVFRQHLTMSLEALDDVPQPREAPQAAYEMAA